MLRKINLLSHFVHTKSSELIPFESRYVSRHKILNLINLIYFSDKKGKKILLYLWTFSPLAILFFLSFMEQEPERWFCMSNKKQVELYYFSSAKTKKTPFLI